jgi:hypothetical protein
MHTNHRRKPPKHHNPHWGWSHKAVQRLFWKYDRARTRRMIHHGEWDLIDSRHRHSILWNWNLY